MKRLLTIMLILVLSCTKGESPVYDTIWTAEAISVDGVSWMDIDTLPVKYQGTIEFASNTHDYMTTGFFGDYNDRYVDDESGRNLYFGSHLYMTITIVGREEGIEAMITLRGGTTFYIRFV